MQAKLCDKDGYADIADVIHAIASRAAHIAKAHKAIDAYQSGSVRASAIKV